MALSCLWLFHELRAGGEAEGLMADEDFHAVLVDTAEYIVEAVKERVAYFVEDMWFALVEMGKPAERLDWYRNIDMVALRETSELLWKLITQDAARLMAAQESQQQAALDRYENIAYAQQHAFQQETQPLGQSPNRDDAFVLGQNTPLPLGRLGG